MKTATRAEVAVAKADDLSVEQALVERARTDANAFAELYDRYVERVYRYGYRRLGSHPEAEDLTALTFERVLESLPRYEARGLPFGAWLFRIAHNLLVDRYRAKPATASLDAFAGDFAIEQEESLGEQEQLDAAWAAVARLPALQRRAIVLRFGRDMSHAQIGPIIGRSETATKQLIYRAIKTLRTRLRDGGETC